MAMQNQDTPNFSTPQQIALPRIAQTMAYGSGAPAPNGLVYGQLHKLRRGFPVLRGGLRVSPIPQFKASPVYSFTPPAGNVKNPANRAAVPTPFQNTAATTNSHTYTWPVGPA